MERSLRLLVARVAALGTGLQLLAWLLLHRAGPIATVPHTLANLDRLHEGTLAGLLLVITLGADLVAVRVHRGAQAVEFTLFDAAVVVDVLLLPVPVALTLPMAASLITSIVRRRAPIKSIFNCANLAAATSVLVLTVQSLSGPGRGLSWQTVSALALGMLAFNAINSIALARVLALLNGGRAWDIVVSEIKLSLVASVGTVALGATMVTVAASAPALLPFTLMPALALTFAYRAAAQEYEERERSVQLLTLSQVLAGRLEVNELLEAFLELTRKAFGADVAMAILDEGALPADAARTTFVDDRVLGPLQRPADEREEALLVRIAADGALALTEGLPGNGVRALAAPLEAEGRRLGAITLVTDDRHRSLGRPELTLLTSLASALAVALRGAAHLQRLTEETSKLKAVVDQSSDGILVLDGVGRVLLWSPALTGLTGRDEPEALGRPLGQLVAALAAGGSPVDPFTAGSDLLTPAEPRATIELTVLRTDGEQRVVRCAHAGAFDDDGTLLRDVVIVHDVTRERQVERLKADFIATVSHELRTPITPIKGYADLLRRRGEAMTPEKRGECLEIISSRTEHLARLVEDLLLASRISATVGAAAAQVEMSTADLTALTRRACQDFGEDGERIVLSLPARPVPVACDAMRVVQVLTNLVGNALKYSEAGTRVDVRLLAGPGTATIEVEDRGRGIPADQLEQVFDKFHRVEDSLRMTTGGTGLGLYIARELANAMNSNLDCQSTLGVGSVFSFTLATAPLGVESGRVPLPRVVAPHVPAVPTLSHAQRG